MGTMVKHSPGSKHWCCPGAERPAWLMQYVHLLGSIPISRFPDVPTNEGADPGEAGVWLEGVVPLGLAPRSPSIADCWRGRGGRVEGAEGFWKGG